MSQSNEVGVYNPLQADFSCNYNDGQGVANYVVPSREIAYFHPAVARHIKKHLYDAIVNDRDLNGIKLNANPKEKQKILDEMEV